MAVTGVIVAAVVSFGLGGLAIVLGPRLGVVDLPDDDLKPHRGRPVPLGGAGLLVGGHVGLAVEGLFDVGLFAATVLVWVMGLIDDIRGLRPLTRLAGATAGGVLLVFVVDGSRQLLESLAWIVVVVVLINAVNLLDGLDALVGSVAIVVLAGLGVFAYIQGMSDPWAMAVLAGALGGFLLWNLPPARLFLGDNGAYVVGVFLAWGAMRASPDRTAALVAVALIGVPILDLGVTVVRRWITGRPLFSGDRDHSYDRLHQEGVSAGRVALVFVAFQVAWMAALLTMSVIWGDRITVAVSLALLLAVTSFVVFRLAR